MNLMMKKIKLAFTIITLMALTACQAGGGYIDAAKHNTVATQFNTQTLQAISANMIQNMLKAPAVNTLSTGQRPIIFIDHLKNNTMEAIDTVAVTQKIRDQVLQSGKFRFVDTTKLNAARKRLDYQAHASQVDPSAAIDFGREIGANYMLYGQLSPITAPNKHEQAVDHKITLRLMDLETGLIEWSSEKTIQTR